MDAVAVGQFTPAPAFTTATFVGYVLDGIPGRSGGHASHLPALVRVRPPQPPALRCLPRLRQSAWASGFIDGVGAAAVATMAVVVVTPGQTVIDDAFAVLALVVAALVLLLSRLLVYPSTVWLILAGGGAGLIIAAVC